MFREYLGLDDTIEKCHLHYNHRPSLALRLREEARPRNHSHHFHQTKWDQPPLSIDDDLDFRQQFLSVYNLANKIKTVT